MGSVSRALFFFVLSETADIPVTACYRKAALSREMTAMRTHHINDTNQPNLSSSLEEELVFMLPR